MDEAEKEEEEEEVEEGVNSPGAPEEAAQMSHMTACRPTTKCRAAWCYGG